MSPMMQAKPLTPSPVVPLDLPPESEHATSIVLDKVTTDYPIKSMYRDIQRLFAQERRTYGENVLSGLRFDIGGVPNRYTILVWLQGEAIRERLIDAAAARGYGCTVYPEDAWYRHEEREKTTTAPTSVWDCLRY